MEEIVKDIEKGIAKRRTITERATGRMPWSAIYRTIRGALNNKLRIANVGGHLAVVQLARRYAKTETTGDSSLDAVIDKAAEKFSTAKVYSKNLYMPKTVYVKRYRKPSVRKRLGRVERELRQRELKTHDRGQSDPLFNAGIGTTASIAPISQTAQGDTSLTREGLQIKPVHLEYKILARSDASATKAQSLRVIIFMDKENQGTYPTAAQLLEQAAPAVYDWSEHDTRPRFKILRDFMFVLPIAAAGNDARFKRGIVKFKRGFRIWYQGTTAAEASNGKNSLFALAISDDNTNTPELFMVTRLRFVDP